MSGLYAAIAENEPQIKTNSFYDVYDEYSEEEFNEYAKAIGIPTANTFEEFLEKL